MAAITRVYTIRMVARILGQAEELLWDPSDRLEPEDGMLWKDRIAACIRHDILRFAQDDMT